MFHESPRLIGTIKLDHANWMQQFQDYRVSEILIPGTHQSPSYKFNWDTFLTEKFAKHQDLSIYDQLLQGTRFLDVRLKSDDGQVWTSHEWSCVLFRTVLMQIKRFVQEHDQEIVFLFLRREHAMGGPVKLDLKHVHDDIVSVLNDGFAYNGNQNFKDYTLKTLVNTGKRIIILNQKDVKVEWPNSPSVQEAKNVLCSIQNSSSYIHDKYHLLECISTLNVQRLIGGVTTDAFNRLIGYWIDKSGYGDQREASKSTNYYCIHELAKYDCVKFNFMTFDFIDDSVMNAIMDINKRRLK